MMGSMSGVRARDVAMSLDLVVAAWEFSRRTLRRAGDGEKPSFLKGRQVWPGGNLLVKFFMHPDLDEFCNQVLKPRFGKVYTEKPKASRAESSEAYWLCQGFKG
ncbi:NADB Rossmann [Naematelia encephala]|uniref:rRNA methyltransferase 2, mitochondrial n=1 Tax=Naematelia encephala TaxID=71784 RepID=A0A1Y2B683_9TREE|nr:NADB Rossmann [Naematelia encephala]